MGLGLGLGLGPALGACWPLLEAQNLIKTALFQRVHVLFKKLTRRRPALSAEGTKLVKMTKIATKLEAKIGPSWLRLIF